MSVIGSTKTVLMLCHDQNLDRRVVAQAQSLISIGVRVTLIALSFGPETSREQTTDGIDLIRIGLSDIIPENPTYRGYMARQVDLNNVLNRSVNRFPRMGGAFNQGYAVASRLNWIAYRLLLDLTYRNRSLHDPLPFRSAFVKHAASIECALIQVHDLPALEAGVELSAARNVPLVYDAHELYPEQRSFSAVQRRVCAMAEGRLIKQARHVFAVNESIGREMSRRYGIAMPDVMLNAIDPPDGFDPNERHDLLRTKLGLAADRRILLFQGGFAPHRNLENLVAAFRQVQTPDVDLVMMGFGPYGDVLRGIAARHGLLGRRVHFLPAVPQSELLQHSASADMGVIPYPHIDLNSYYCTPNKLFEFIQAGLPILANESPELTRFVVKEGFGIARPLHTAAQIAAAVDHAFSLPDAVSWRRNLLQRRAAFSWQGQAAAYLAVMNAFIGDLAASPSVEVAQ